MKIRINYWYLLLVLLYGITDVSKAQSKKTTSRPPWIVGEAPSWNIGELPRIDLQGNILRVEFTQDVNPETAEKKQNKQLLITCLKEQEYI